MKCAYPEPEHRAARERFHSLFHLPRGLVREGYGEDLPGRDSVVFHQVGDAVRYHSGLSRTGTREYQKRAFAVTHRLGLGRVQSFEKILFHGCRNLTIAETMVEKIVLPDEGLNCSFVSRTTVGSVIPKKRHQFRMFI